MAFTKRKPLLERFQEKVQISKDNEWNGSPCWDWTAYRSSTGYGRLRIDGKKKLSHRVAWELHRGKIPEGLCVLHQCDRPCCVNPKHLFIGTQKENVEDREAKRRGAIGTRNGRAFLTEAEVRLVKQFLRRCTVRGVGSFLSRWFGVNCGTIYDIKHGRNWTHVK